MADKVIIKASDIEEAFNVLSEHTQSKGFHSFSKTLFIKGDVTVRLNATAVIGNKEVVDEEATAKAAEDMRIAKENYEAEQAQLKAEAEEKGITLEELLEQKRQEDEDKWYAQQAEEAGMTVEEFKAKEEADRAEQEEEGKRRQAEWEEEQAAELDLTIEEYREKIQKEQEEAQKNSEEWNKKWRAEECEKHNCTDEELDAVLAEYNQEHMWDPQQVMKTVLGSDKSEMPTISISAVDTMFGGTTVTALGDKTIAEITDVDTMKNFFKTYLNSDKFKSDLAEQNTENETEIEISFEE